MRNEDVERLAETHFMIRPTLRRALEATQITPEGSATLSAPASSYLEIWERSFSDRWFDMTTMVRLGTAVETGLRDCHRRIAPGIEPDRGVFQRLVNPSSLLRLFADDCSVDLTASPEWPTMQEVMVHRHLYAHRSGLIDNRYVDDLLSVAGVDIRLRIEELGYPAADVYWFEPLSRISGFIEAARRFFRPLP